MLNNNNDECFSLTINENFTELMFDVRTWISLNALIKMSDMKQKVYLILRGIQKYDNINGVPSEMSKYTSISVLTGSDTILEIF